MKTTRKNNNRKYYIGVSNIIACGSFKTALVYWCMPSIALHMQNKESCIMWCISSIVNVDTDYSAHAHKTHISNQF